MLTRVIHPDQLTKSEIADHDVIVIGDASRLSDKMADEVAAFVQQGGGLLLFSSKSIDKNWHNARWGSNSKTSLLPADYFPEAKPLANVAHISEEISPHAALGFLKQLGGENFSSVEIKNVLGVKLNSNSESSEMASHVLLKLDSGKALLVTKPFGAGNVLQFSTSADTSDTNLPLRPVYVPLMQSLVQWLALGTDSNRNATTGQSLAIKFTSGAVDEKAKPSERVAIVTLPDRSQVEKVLEPNGQLSFSETAFPGVYSIVIAKDTGDRNVQDVEHFAVNAPSEESELQFLTPQQINELATATGASVAANVQELLTMQSLRANGREAWRWFLLALVALLFVELWWQQRITRGPL